MCLHLIKSFSFYIKLHSSTQYLFNSVKKKKKKSCKIEIFYYNEFKKQIIYKNNVMLGLIKCKKEEGNFYWFNFDLRLIQRVSNINRHLKNGNRLLFVKIKQANDNINKHRNFTCKRMNLKRVMTFWVRMCAYCA